MVCIFLNGTQHQAPPRATVALLIESLGLVSEQVAVELNHVMVQRARHAEERLQEGDRIEIVTLVGGG